MDDTAKFAIAFCGILAFVLVGILGLVVYSSAQQKLEEYRVREYMKLYHLDEGIAYDYCVKNIYTKVQCAGWSLYPAISHSHDGDDVVLHDP